MATCRELGCNREATHTEEPVRVAASDGGAVVEQPEERPDDCDCGEWNDGLELPCWPCYRDGFDTPASADEEVAR